MRARDIPARERLLAKLVPQSDGCWHWAGFINTEGYGRIGYEGRRGTPLHQAVYMEFAGPIPDGLVVDHVCHSRDATCPGGDGCQHRRCGNPAHLELVTPADNTRRAWSGARELTECRHGHAYTPENSYYRKSDGRRICRTCRQALELRRRARGAA